MDMINSKLQQELDNYVNNKSGFLPYYPNMNILISNLYKEHLDAVLKLLEEENPKSSKSFKLYLDTIIINMHSKIKKYKQSAFFTNEHVKDIENQGYLIPFFIDEQKDIYVILGLVKNQSQSNSVINSNSSI